MKSSAKQMNSHGIIYYENLNQMKIVCYKFCFALYQHPADDILKYFSQTMVLTFHALYLDISCLISSPVETICWKKSFFFFFMSGKYEKRFAVFCISM